MSKKISTDPAVIQEAKTFISKLISYSAEIGEPPEVCLTVMLFESAESLNSKFSGDGGRASGLLQYTKEFAASKGLLINLGYSNATFENVAALSVQAFQKSKSQNRLQQLEVWRIYHLFHKAANKKSFAGGNKYLRHYVRTLAPNGGADYKDGNGVTASSLTSGQGRTGDQWNRCRKLADDILAGKEPIPGEDNGSSAINGYKALAAYHARVGYVLVNPGTLPPASAGTAAAPSSTAAAAAATAADAFPVKISINIPEYPRLIGIKPGDVIILPATSQLRDWVIESIERTFTQGLNTLVLSGGRPLDPSPFVQTELLTRAVSNPMSYYYLG